MQIPPDKLKGPKWLRDHFHGLARRVEEIKPVAGLGTQVIDSAGGRIINVRGGGGGGPSISAAHPFYVHTLAVDDSTYFGVDPASDLWIGISFDKQEITGLLTDISDPDDPNWHAATAGICYLAGTLDTTGAITACEIKWGGKLAGESVGTTEILRIKTEDATETVPAYQSQFNVPIARLTSTTVGDVTTWAVEQLAERHLTILDLNINAILCRYPLAVF